MAVTGLLDERIVITSFVQFLYSAITKLDFNHHGSKFHGTGVMVALNHVLTAAHNAYDTKSNTYARGMRATISSKVHSKYDNFGTFILVIDGEKIIGLPLPHVHENVTNTNYLLDFDKTKSEADDIALY